MYYKKNLAALEKSNPQLAQLIDSTKLTNRYKLIPSQRHDKIPTILDLKTNRNYYNSLDPILSAKKDITSKNFYVPDIAIFLGFGAGYHIGEYFNKFNNAKIIAFEADLELLKVVFTNIKLTDLLNHDRFILLGGVEPYTLYPLMVSILNEQDMVSYLKSINFVELPTSVIAYKGYYIKIIQVVKQAIKSVIDLYGNDPEDSLIGIRYTLQNIATIINNPGIQDLQDAFKGKPGVLVASGPSLDKNIHLLKEIEDKAVITAADGSVKILKKYGIKPAHFVTSLERVENTALLFSDLEKSDTENSFLAACPVILPVTYSAYPGDNIIVYRNFATFQWLDIPKGTLDIGPSAGNMAFKLLEYLGCDPIILIGQDLAYGDTGKSHAEGFHFGHDSRFLGNVVVEGNYQPTVTTTDVWYSFLTHYHRDIEQFSGTVINATEGGAKIPGTVITTFKDAIDKYIHSHLNVYNIIKDKLKIPKKNVKLNTIDTTKNKIDDAVKYTDSLISTMEESLQLVLELDKYIQETAQEQLDNEYVDNTINILSKKLQIFSEKKFYLILMHYVQSFIMKMAMDINATKFNIKPSLELASALVDKFKELFSVTKLLLIKINVDFIKASEGLTLQKDLLVIQDILNNLGNKHIKPVTKNEHITLKRYITNGIKYYNAYIERATNILQNKDSFKALINEKLPNPTPENISIIAKEFNNFINIISYNEILNENNYAHYLIQNRNYIAVYLKNFDARAKLNLKTNISKFLDNPMMTQGDIHGVTELIDIYLELYKNSINIITEICNEFENKLSLINKLEIK